MSSLRVLCLQKWLKIDREPAEYIPNNISCSPDFLKKEVMLLNSTLEIDQYVVTKGREMTGLAKEPIKSLCGWLMWPGN